MSKKDNKAPSIMKTTEDFSTEAAKNAKSNAEILHEIFQVVFMQEPKDRADFGNWTDTLNQGASFEGVYNGLIHSSDYRKLEESIPGASAGAVRAFGEELALLEAELPLSGQLEAEPHDAGDSSSAESSSGSSLETKYSKRFVGGSIYTLKRILGEEALKVVDLKGEYKEKLALWYSKWIVHMAQRKVDFGLLLRNKPDEAFHYKWVLENKEDRVKWEVLNRLHRVLNEANRLKQ